MIATDPEVVKYIKEFEKLEGLLRLKSEELSEQSQKVLYMITKMFTHDPLFRGLFEFLARQFSKDITTLSKEEFKNHWMNVIKFVAHKEYQKEEAE